jgi:hypothetical protein
VKFFLTKLAQEVLNYQTHNVVGGADAEASHVVTRKREGSVLEIPASLEMISQGTM